MELKKSKIFKISYNKYITATSVKEALNYIFKDGFEVEELTKDLTSFDIEKAIMEYKEKRKL